MEKNASCFPLFVDLYGRRCVIVGGGAIAARRAAVLGEFGAAVTVIAPEWKGGVRNIDWVPRVYVPGDLAGAFLAVAATDDREVNRSVGEAVSYTHLTLPLGLPQRRRPPQGRRSGKRSAKSIGGIGLKRLRAGSRESLLAVVQTETVMDAVRTWDPTIHIELVTMKTTGDKILDRTLDKVGGKGLFVKELDAALLDGQVDFTVHSCKDLPMELDPRLPLAGFSHREDPRDALVLPLGVGELDPTKPIGCASARRTLQLRRLFPGQPVAPVRGNVQTRLRKLDEGQYAALVLAAAGLRRLGLEERIARYFTTEEMIPAAGQGILAVQVRAGEDVSWLERFRDRDGTDCALAERAFVRRLDGGCSSPVAAFATVEGDTLILRGMDVGPDGEARFDAISGPRTRGEALGIELAERIREGDA